MAAGKSNQKFQRDLFGHNCAFGPIDCFMYSYWLPSCAPGINFTQVSRAHNWNHMKYLFILNLIPIIKPGHKFAQLSWHVQNCDLIWQLFFITEQQVSLWYLSFWARKPFVEGAPDEMRGTWGQYLYNINTDAPMSLSHIKLQQVAWKTAYDIYSSAQTPFYALSPKYATPSGNVSSGLME